MYLVLPKKTPNPVVFREFPLFFLAGPIKGGGDWQKKMMMLLMERLDKLVIVNPSRYPTSHPFYHYVVAEEGETFARQTDWERHYLEQAALGWPRGCIIFWLGAESKGSPRTDGQTYARDTLGEVGEWRGRMLHNPHLRIVMGMEGEFPGQSQILRNFELALPNFSIYQTMEEVADQAAKFALV